MVVTRIAGRECIAFWAPAPARDFDRQRSRRIICVLCGLKARRPQDDAISFRWLWDLYSTGFDCPACGTQVIPWDPETTICTDL